MSTSLVKSEQTHRLGQNEAGVRLAEAALELARLNLSYTVIIAPVSYTHLDVYKRQAYGTHFRTEY